VSRRLYRHALAVCILASAGCLDSPTDGNDAPVQLLANPDFEQGVAGWFFDGSVEVDTTEVLGLPASAAGGHAALLGRGNNQTDVVRQDVTVPDSAHRLELSGVRCYSTDEGTDDVYDTLVVSLTTIDGEPLEVLVESSNLDATPSTCEWLPFTIATDDHAGEALRLLIEAVTDDGVRTSFAIDGLALTARP